MLLTSNRCGKICIFIDTDPNSQGLDWVIILKASVVDGVNDAYHPPLGLLYVERYVRLADPPGYEGLKQPEKWADKWVPMGDDG